MNKEIDYLIVATKNDFTSDFICIQLNIHKKNYLRINRDEFSTYKIIWDVNNEVLSIGINNNRYLINNNLKAVYYRAPVYMRYYSHATKEEQLYKSQWMAFIKNLMFFDDARWINNPAKTYKAENKILQLKYAKVLGFNIPKTKIINTKCNDLDNNKNYAIKSIDTLLLRYDKKEAFLYTNIINGKTINESDLNYAPFVVQEFLNPKIDLRVTVVANTCYTVKILKGKNGTYEDWRKEKDNVQFVKYQLPKNIEDKCISLVKKFDLLYGGIDLILVNEEYYFIEINPTGEWAWLVENPGFDIHKKIVDVLIGNLND